MTLARLRTALNIKEGKPYPKDEAEPPQSEGEKVQTELSRQLVRLVDVLYALVLVQGAVYYRYVFTLPSYFKHTTNFMPVALALVLIYFTTIQSFIDYHLASEDQKYQILNKEHRGLDLLRYYFDIVIVGSYSFLLLKCHSLIWNPGADISATFWALSGVFLLYLCWGELRKMTQLARDKPYTARVLVVALLLYLLLAVTYAQMPGGSLRNSSALGAAIVLMAAYRWLNWPQNRAIDSVVIAPPPSPAAGKAPT